MIFLLLSILSYLPWVNETIRVKGEWEVEFIAKRPSLDWITSFFSMMFSFNLQIYALDIKKELLFPSTKRLNKINSYATACEFLICIAVGMIAYICLGDKYTPSLILLRKSDTGSLYEHFLTFLTIAFFILLIYSMPIFNPSTREYLLDFLPKDKQE